MSINVKRIRAQLGLTQRAFANEIGVSQAEICRWERKHDEPTGPARFLLERIAADLKAQGKQARAS